MHALGELELILMVYNKSATQAPTVCLLGSDKDKMLKHFGYITVIRTRSKISRRFDDSSDHSCSFIQLPYDIEPQCITNSNAEL